MLRYGVRKLDAIVYTHHHADHIMGLDDVFPFNVWSGKDLPLYANSRTLEEIQITFRHLFAEDRYPGIASLQPRVIDGDFRVGSLRFQPVEVMHGKLPVLGFRVGEFAYITDVNHIPDPSLEKLDGLRYLVLDGLRYKSHRTHFSIEEAIEVANRVKPRQTYLIHMCHDVEHEEGNAGLPEDVALAYDGLVLDF
jgi:phosphoribosyl 1,2-cyclic phosphate phosphodiesterase